MSSLLGSSDEWLRRRAEKMDLCCVHPMLMVTDDGSLSLACTRCRDRMCPHCESRRCLKSQARVTRELAGFDSVRMLTLTVRGSGESLKVQLAHLFDSFRSLRRRDEWKRNVRRGVYALQVTRDIRKKTWHAHLHVLADGDYWAQVQLSDLWHKSTGDSKIVDIRAIHSRAHAAKYIARYVTRADSVAGWPSADICEYAIAMSGVRLFQSFGEKVKVDLDQAEPNEPPSPRSSVLEIRDVNCLASHNDEDAIEVVACSRRLQPWVGRIFDPAIAARCDLSDVPDRVLLRRLRDAVASLIRRRDEANPRPAPLLLSHKKREIQESIRDLYK